jgi:hypothetical protein
MSSPIITGLMIFFSVTTIGVVLYPLIKLTPSWLERSLNKKINFHRDAVVALANAVERTHNDPVQRARLQAQHDYHRSALTALVPGEAVAPVAIPRALDAAA